MPSAQLDRTIPTLRHEIRRQRIVPVVGPGLLRSTEESTTLAQRVLDEFRIKGQASSLFDATQNVCATEASGHKRLEEVRAFVQEMVAQRREVPSLVLDQLASVTSLRTVLATTIESDLDFAFRRRAATAAQVATVAYPLGVHLRGNAWHESERRRTQRGPWFTCSVRHFRQRWLTMTPKRRSLSRMAIPSTSFPHSLTGT